jgi:hypothetical protein
MTVTLRAERNFDGEFALASIKAIAKRNPGPEDLMVHVGNSRLRLGSAWQIDPSNACLAALGEWGDVVIEAAA